MRVILRYVLWMVLDGVKGPSIGSVSGVREGISCRGTGKVNSCE